MSVVDFEIASTCEPQIIAEPIGDRLLRALQTFDADISPKELEILSSGGKNCSDADYKTVIDYTQHRITEMAAFMSDVSMTSITQLLPEIEARIEL
jgi:hypothetical protein